MAPSSTVPATLVSLGLASATPWAQEPAELPELRLEVAPPPLEGLRQSLEPRGQVRASWEGRLGGCEVAAVLLHLEMPFSEPGDVTELIVDHLRRRANALEVAEQYFLQGEYGHASFASVLVGPIREPGRTDVAGRQYLLGGLLAAGGYALHVQCRPQPSDESDAAIRGWLEDAVTYRSEPRDPEWSDEEIRERWTSDAPAELHEDFVRALGNRRTARKVVIRTDNYIIFTNSSGGRLFARKMEENYDEIRATYPFEDVDGRRLMPVFLFRTADQYYDFYARKAGVGKAAARRSKGHAWQDYYATWYEAPGDPVHIHEATHQIFTNRLRLPGGGSWFQEGVAEYIETSDNDRNEVANLVERGEHTPLRKFFALPSLLYSSEANRKTGGSEAADHYKQAALLIEFLRESRFGREGFPELMRAVGKAPANDLERIEEILQAVYEVTIDELDERFQRYCRRR